MSDPIDLSFASLVRQFPALYQISIVQTGRVRFHYTNPKARESKVSVLYRGIMRLWAALHSSPGETFQHRIGEQFNIRSASKSIVALLVGIALRDGLLASLDQMLGDLLPSELTRDLDARKRQISLRHLLTMTSGLESMESGMNAIRMLASRNWTRFMLDLRLVAEPGKDFIYNSANPHLVSAILAHLSGDTLLAYAIRNLFEPLGIRGSRWGASPDGITFGGGNLFLSGGDLLRIGELCLLKGRWNDRQIIPEAWFGEMWQPHQEYFPGWKYGYYWYLHDEVHPKTGRSYATYSAAGSGGQKILLIPDLDLVLSAVAITDFIGEHGIALNRFISTTLFDIIDD